MEDVNALHLQKHTIIQESVCTATKLDGLVVTNINNKTQTRHEHFGCAIPKFVKHIKTWGEAGVVKTKIKTAAKLINKGTTCMIVGHVDQHDGDCYRMWYPLGHYVCVTRNVIWLIRMHYQKN